jgi:hypothetical protein
MTVIPATWDGEVEGWQSKASLGKSMSPYLRNKLKESKRSGGVAQVVEFLSEL